jgi:hypothetical protein
MRFGASRSIRKILPIFRKLTQTKTPTLPIIPMALSGMILWALAQYPYSAQNDA